MTAPSAEKPRERRLEVQARTVKDFCRVYGVGKSWVYDKIADGTLRAKKAGTKTLIVEDSAVAWFESLPPPPNAGKTIHKPKVAIVGQRPVCG